MNSTYEDWLERQSKLIKKALKLLEGFKFKAVIITQEKKASFIRVYIRDKRVDFHIKEVKSKFSRSVWVCKKEDFSPKHNYLIFQSKEERWVIASGRQIDDKAEFRDSDYHQGKKFVVVPMETFRSAKPFFKRMKEAYEKELQRRMSDWF